MWFFFACVFVTCILSNTQSIQKSTQNIKMSIIKYETLQIILLKKMGYLAFHTILQENYQLIMHFLCTIMCLIINISFNHFKLTILKAISQANAFVKQNT